MNYLLLMMSLFGGAVISASVIGQHESMVEMSRMIYGTDYPLMGSWFHHYVLQPATGYLCTAVLLGILAKEFVITDLNRRLMINVLGFVAVNIFIGFYMAAMHLPGTT